MNFKEYKKFQVQEKANKEFLKKISELQNKLQALHSVMRLKCLIENTETILDEETCIIEPRYDDCMFYGTINILRKGVDGLGKTWFYLSFNTSQKDPSDHTFSFTEYSDKGVPIYNITLGFQEFHNYFGDASPLQSPEDIKTFKDYLMHLYKERKNKQQELKSYTEQT